MQRKFWYLIVDKKVVEKFVTKKMLINYVNSNKISGDIYVIKGPLLKLEKKEMYHI